MTRFLPTTRHSIIGGMLWTVFAAVATGQGVETNTLRRKQEDQQRARTMTRELVGSVLDVQLRQLEDNGLEDMPVYNDIQLMRKNLATVVDGEMVKVVELLTEAQRMPADQRQATFVEARKQIRSVVVRLTAERQSLLRRLRMAELAEQARRLIGIQSGVRTVTVSIPEEAKSRQESLLLKTQEDQRDVKELFLHLVQTLDDVRQWGGPVADASTEGLRVLKAADVGRHVDRAEAELVAAQPPKAIEHQDGVLKGLRDLLKILERTQGAISNENREVLDRVRAVVEKQEQLQQETKKLDPSQPAPEALVEKQAEIQTAVAELEKLLPELPTAERLTEQAEAAAKEATSELFEGNLAAAVTEQSAVLGNLAALEQLLAQGGDEPAADHTAAELAKRVADLQQAKAKLEEAAKKQDAAAEKADTSAKDAAPLEKEAADAIDAAEKVGTLPADVKRRIEEAEQAARSAEAVLSSATGEASAKEEAALAKADDALDRAQASVEAALNDAERQAAAVKIGELARAAEALERAAAEERAIAKAAETDAADGSVMAEEAQALENRQGDVEALTDKLAEALKVVAPATAAAVASASDAAEMAGKQFEAGAKDGTTPEDAAKSAKAGAETAKDAAKQLAEAAQQLREDVRQAALALAKESQGQAEQLASARETVEEALNGPTVALAEQMAQLQAAQKKTAEASRLQQQASGRPTAAKAMSLAEQIADAKAAQQIADNAAADLANGAAATPLKASAQQQAVAELAEAATAQVDTMKASPPNSELKAALEEAQAAAAAAAKDLFDGKTAAADAAQKKVDAALDRAAKLAQTEAQAAMQAAPSAAPDLATQKAAEQAARAAEELAGSDAPLAAEALGDAAEAGADASKELASGQTDAAKPAQQQAEKKLAQAEKSLAAALDDLARQQQAELARQAARANKLVDTTAKLEPTATEAIEAAEAAATKGAMVESDPHDQVNAATSAERQLERAAATLAAKEQQVRRDQSVAEALAALAAQQKDAAAMLDQQRALAEAMTPGVEPTNPGAFDAAKAQQAASDFAETQRATGQGAAEVSGQQQVANPPLREALEMAAALLSSQQAALAAMEKPLVGELQPFPSPKEQDGQPMPADGQPKGEGTPSDDAPGQPGDAAGQPGPPSSEPGMSDTGFVPQSPELTAQLLAGPEATAAIQAAQQAPPGTKPSQTPNANASPTPPSQQASAQSSPMPDGTPGTGFTGQKPSADAKNAPVKEGAIEKQPEKTDLGDTKGGKREGDADAATRQFQDQPWFAKLPPELRRSIRAGAQQKPPRAYEERLKRYFQSVD